MTPTTPSPVLDERARSARVLGLARSWLSTALGSSLLAWEIPLVVAIVGRMSHGPEAMAVLGAGLSVLVVVNSPALALAPLVVAEAHARGSVALSRQTVITGVAGSVVLAALAALPGVSTAFPAVLGLPDQLRADFRLCLLSFATAPAAVALRRYLHGRLIAVGTTGAIATATLVRIAVTVVVGLAELRAGAPAAVVGGIALSCGAWAEAASLVQACRRAPAGELGVTVTGAPVTGRLLTQHARLTSVVLLTMGPSLVTTVVVAWSQRSSESLIVWPALYGLVSLGTVPLSDLDSVGAAFLRRGGPRSVLRRFVLLLSGGLLAGALLITAAPFARLFLEDFSSVPPEPADLGLQWAPLLALAPCLWALRGGLRAAAIAEGRTGTLPRAAAVHLAVLLAVGGVLPFTSLPGVGCATVALLTALLAEIAGLRVLGRRLADLERSPGAEGRLAEPLREPLKEKG